MKVYLYKEYNDAYAYGEEFIKIFATLEDASEYYRNRVVKYFGKRSYDKAAREFMKPEYDAYIGDPEMPYLSIRSKDGYAFFVVEEHEVVKSSKDEALNGSCGKETA